MESIVETILLDIFLLVRIFVCVIEVELNFYQVGGGLASRMTVQSTLVKECIEEAAIPEELARHARPAGTVR